MDLLRMCSRGLLAMIFSIGASTPLAAQARDIKMGDVTLAFGATLDDVEARFKPFGAEYRLWTLPTADKSAEIFNVFVSQRRSQVKDDWTSLGTLTFKNGILGSIIRNWLDPSVPNRFGTLDLTDAIDGAMASVVAGGVSTACSLRVETDDGPDIRTRRAIIDCGLRSIDISRSRSALHGADSEGITISETIDSEDFHRWRASKATEKKKTAERKPES